MLTAIASTAHAEGGLTLIENPQAKINRSTTELGPHGKLDARKAFIIISRAPAHEHLVSYPLSDIRKLIIRTLTECSLAPAIVQRLSALRARQTE